VPALIVAAASAPLLLVRIALAALALPALYRALSDHGEGWGGRASSVARRLIFAALGALIFFNLTANWVPEERAPSQGRGFQAFATGTYTFRLSHSTLAESAGTIEGGAPTQTAIRQLTKAAELLPESASIRRTLGVALADRGDYAAARKELGVAMDRIAPRAPDRARLERHLWERLFGARVPTPAEIRDVGGQLQRLDLGWWGQVAELAAYGRIGKDAAPAALREAVTAGANTYFSRVLSGIVFPFWIIPCFGLISFVVGLVLIQTGVARPAPQDTHPVAGVLWESFILMMAVMATPISPLFGARVPAPETNPGLFAALMLVKDVAIVLPVFYLWWRLRRRGLTLAEVGLTTKHLGANLMVGFMAAMVMIPASIFVGWVTHFISDRFFPNIAPPYHPLQGLTATSSSGAIRLALFTAAAVGAPLIEETFFRGCLFGALRRRHGFWAALLGSSAFFAILHPQLPLGFLPIALLGAAFAALYEWRQSLVPAMVAHALNNGMAFMLMNLLFPAKG
jgi:membrane protease YdiL (CAAX protease family)